MIIDFAFRGAVGAAGCSGLDQLVYFGEMDYFLGGGAAEFGKLSEFRVGEFGVQLKRGLGDAIIMDCG